MTYRLIALVPAALLVITSTGCATKKFVRKTVDPINSHMSELDKRSAENAAATKDLDDKTQRQVSRVDEKATSADARAAAAGQRAEQAGAQATQAADKAAGAQTLAENGMARTGKLERVVENLDNFHLASQKTVYFKFNKSELQDEDKQMLGELATPLNAEKRFVIEVQGFTDGTGPDEYNYALSARRADAVVRHLATQHKIPVYRIHTLALGKEMPAEQNTSREGRKLNRRVEVRLYVPKADEGTQVASQQ